MEGSLDLYYWYLGITRVGVGVEANLEARLIPQAWSLLRLNFFGILIFDIFLSEDYNNRDQLLPSRALCAVLTKHSDIIST